MPLELILLLGYLILFLACVISYRYKQYKLWKEPKEDKVLSKQNKKNTTTKG